MVIVILWGNIRYFIRVFCKSLWCEWLLVKIKLTCEYCIYVIAWVYTFNECFHYLFIFYAVNPLFYLEYEYSSFIVIINNKRDQNYLTAKVKLYITCTICRRYVQIIHGIILKLRYLINGRNFYSISLISIVY